MKTNGISLIFAKYVPNGIGVEIGVNVGNNASIILNMSTPKKLYLVDSWKYYGQVSGLNYYGDQKAQDETYNSVVRRFDGDKRVEIVREESLVASQKFSDGFFDFVYIDADHTYESVRSDVVAWYPKLRDGGVFSGHDYSSRKSKAGLKLAVDEFCKSIGKDVNITSDRVPSWYFIK